MPAALGFSNPNSRGWSVGLSYQHQRVRAVNGDWNALITCVLWHLSQCPFLVAVYLFVLPTYGVAAAWCGCSGMTSWRRRREKGKGEGGGQKGRKEDRRVRSSVVSKHDWNIRVRVSVASELLTLLRWRKLGSAHLRRYTDFLTKESIQ